VGKIRKLRKLSQEELGLLTGTSQMTIQRIEKAVGGTRLETVLAVAHGLKLSAVDLFQEIEGRRPRPVGDLSSKWENIVMYVDRLPEKEKDWLAELIKHVVNKDNLLH